MKKIIILLSASFALISFSACTNFLDEQNPNSIPSDTYFSNESDVEKAVLGIYQAMRSGNCLGEGSTLFTEERSDNTGRLDNQSSAGEPFQFTDFSILPTNTNLKSHWTAMYTAITRTNFVLSNIDKVKFENENTKLNLKAEALFARALVYFHLVRKWGDVPLVTTFLSSYQDIEAHTFRSPKSKVYEQIIADLKEASTSTLPNIQPTSGKGRACKAAITGLLGQVYLTLATTESDNKKSNLENAKLFLEQAYAMREFDSLSTIPYTDVFDVEKKNTCPEIIFQIVYKQGDLNYSSSIARNNQSVGIKGINSLFNTTGTGTYVNLDLIHDYEENDLRKAWSVMYDDNPKAKVWSITKYRDISSAAGTSGYGGNDFILMRYADIILMLAEVNCYLNNTSAAISYLNQVRIRAGLPDYQTSMLQVDYSSKYPTLQLAILHERRVELAFENHRLFDLLRTFSTADFVSYIQAKEQTNYGISNPKNCGAKDIYYPIPFDEWKLNPEKMYQNEGY